MALIRNMFQNVKRGFQKLGVKSKNEGQKTKVQRTKARKLRLQKKMGRLFKRNSKKGNNGQEEDELLAETTSTEVSMSSDIFTQAPSPPGGVKEDSCHDKLHTDEENSEEAESLSRKQLLAEAQHEVLSDMMQDIDTDEVNNIRTEPARLEDCVTLATEYLGERQLDQENNKGDENNLGSENNHGADKEKFDQDNAENESSHNSEGTALTPSKTMPAGFAYMDRLTSPEKENVKPDVSPPKADTARESRPRASSADEVLYIDRTSGTQKRRNRRAQVIVAKRGASPRLKQIGKDGSVNMEISFGRRIPRQTQGYADADNTVDSPRINVSEPSPLEHQPQTPHQSHGHGADDNHTPVAASNSQSDDLPSSPPSRINVFDAESLHYEVQEESSPKLPPLPRPFSMLQGSPGESSSFSQGDFNTPTRRQGSPSGLGQARHPVEYRGNTMDSHVEQYRAEADTQAQIHPEAGGDAAGGDAQTDDDAPAPSTNGNEIDCRLLPAL